MPTYNMLNKNYYYSHCPLKKRPIKKGGKNRETCKLVEVLKNYKNLKKNTSYVITKTLKTFKKWKKIKSQRKCAKKLNLFKNSKNIFQKFPPDCSPWRHLRKTFVDGLKYYFSPPILEYRNFARPWTWKSQHQARRHRSRGSQVRRQSEDRTKCGRSSGSCLPATTVARACTARQLLPFPALYCFTAAPGHLRVA